MFLALGAGRLAQKNMLTRRMPAIESLGAATVLCVDKTGTLTITRMTVSRLCADGEFYDVAGAARPTLPQQFHSLVRFALLASETEPFDPMENAFKDLADRSLDHDPRFAAWTLARVYALAPGYRESKESWAEVLRQLKSRGVQSARLFVGDGNLGLWAAVGEVYPQACQQLCWNHKMLNVMDAVSQKEQPEIKKHLNAMMYADSREQALKERKKFEQGFGHNPKAIKTVVENWERLTRYYDFPREHWKHLRTSNVVESPFSRVRLRTTASRRFKSLVNATCLIWKTLMIAEMSFRKLDAPQRVVKVARGQKYANGQEVRVAA